MSRYMFAAEQTLKNERKTINPPKIKNGSALLFWNYSFFSLWIFSIPHHDYETDGNDERKDSKNIQYEPARDWNEFPDQK